MRRAPGICALLMIVATTASAAGLNLRWTGCVGDGGVQNRAFACDTNSGFHSLVGSLVLAADQPAAAGFVLVLDLAAASSTLPDWWGFIALGSCRRTSLSISAHEGSHCPDPFAFQAAMSITGYETSLHGAAHRARVHSQSEVWPELVTELAAGQEYGVARWRISSTNTSGTGSCAGCEVPVCLVFQSARLSTVDHQNEITLTTEAFPGSNYVTWQGGGGTNCPAATPTKNSTWGALKSLYR